jgi:hypothetical protein
LGSIAGVDKSEPTFTDKLCVPKVFDTAHKNAYRDLPRVALEYEMENDLIKTGRGANYDEREDEFGGDMQSNLHRTIRMAKAMDDVFVSRT